MIAIGITCLASGSTLRALRHGHAAVGSSVEFTGRSVHAGLAHWTALCAAGSHVGIHSLVLVSDIVHSLLHRVLHRLRIDLHSLSLHVTILSNEVEELLGCNVIGIDVF